MIAELDTPLGQMRASMHAQDRERARVEIFSALCRINSAAAAYLRRRTRLEPGGVERLTGQIELLDKLISGAEIEDCRAAIAAHAATFDRMRVSRDTNDSSRVLIALGFECLPLIEKLKTLTHICDAYPLAAQRRAAELVPDSELA